MRNIISVLCKKASVVIGDNLLRWFTTAEDDPKGSFWFIRISQVFGFLGNVMPKKDVD